MKHLLPNVADVLADRALGGHEFTIIRTRGAWEEGRFVSREERVTAYGNIQAAPGGETDALPEGGRPQEHLVLRCLHRVLLTGDDKNALADVIEYHGSRYKVYKRNDWSEYGYTEAYLKRM